MSSGYRRAALALHGLAEQDRSWILKELPDTDKVALTQLLDELDELGFSGDVADVVQAADGSSVSSTAGPHSGAHSMSRVEQVRRASAEDMFAILENEPGSLIAQILSMESWPWAARFLALFPEARRSRISSLISHGQEAIPARHEFLLQSVAGRLTEIAGLPVSRGVNGGAWIPGARTKLHALVSVVPFLAALWK